MTSHLHREGCGDVPRNSLSGEFSKLLLAHSSKLTEDAFPVASDKAKFLRLGHKRRRDQLKPDCGIVHIESEAFDGSRGQVLQG
ncbi:hypothetical protein AWC15_14505 [Mycobacterium lacus]|nr:hypothetical protein AWC15_14505 [Mycobacterium lacus]